MGEQEAYKPTIQALKQSLSNDCIHNYADLTKGLEIMAPLQTLEITIGGNQMMKKQQESSTR